MREYWPVLVVVLVVVAVVISVGGVLLLISSPSRAIGTTLTYEVDSQDGRDAVPVDMERLIDAIERRVNSGWPPRARIRPIGHNEIEIGIFGNDPKMVQRIERLLASVGTLEFRILANRRDHPSLIEQAKNDSEADRIEADGTLLGWWVPVAPGNENGFDYPEISTRTRKTGKRETLEVLVVKDSFDVTGNYLRRVAPDVDRRGQPCLSFELDQVGGKLFGGLTGSNLPDPMQDFTRKLGIILNGRLHSAPAIQSTIFGGGEITGSFTREEVEELTAVFNAGSLPAAIHQIQRRRSPGLR